MSGAPLPRPPGASGGADPGRIKRRAAGLSIGSNTFLVLLKLTIGVMTGSVAVLSEAVHSAMDLLAALIAFVAVSLSDRPPDSNHPHGHGKIESLSGAVEALLIFGAVFFIAHEAWYHLPVSLTVPLRVSLPSDTT